MPGPPQQLIVHPAHTCDLCDLFLDTPPKELDGFALADSLSRGPLLEDAEFLADVLRLRLQLKKEKTRGASLYYSRFCETDPIPGKLADRHLELLDATSRCEMAPLLLRARACDLHLIQAFAGAGKGGGIKRWGLRTLEAYSALPQPEAGILPLLRCAEIRWRLRRDLDSALSHLLTTAEEGFRKSRISLGDLRDLLSVLVHLCRPCDSYSAKVESLLAQAEDQFISLPRLPDLLEEALPLLEQFARDRWSDREMQLRIAWAENEVSAIGQQALLTAAMRRAREMGKAKQYNPQLQEKYELASRRLVAELHPVQLVLTIPRPDHEVRQEVLDRLPNMCEVAQLALSIVQTKFPEPIDRARPGTAFDLVGVNAVNPDGSLVTSAADTRIDGLAAQLEVCVRFSSQYSLPLVLTLADGTSGLVLPERVRDDARLIHAGARHLAEGNGRAGVAVAIPAVESLARLLTEAHGGNTRKAPSAGRRGGSAALGELVNKEKLGLDGRDRLVDLLSVTVADPDALNIRNNVVHGIVRDVDTFRAALVLHASLALLGAFLSTEEIA